MNNDFNNCSGTLKVSENVITEIAVNAVSETDGVYLRYKSGYHNRFE